MNKAKEHVDVIPTINVPHNSEKSNQSIYEENPCFGNWLIVQRYKRKKEWNGKNKEEVAIGSIKKKEAGLRDP